MIRPISRKYDLKEHAYPVELDTLASLFEGISDANTISFAGAEAFRDSEAIEGKPQWRQHVRGAQCDRDQLG